MAARARWRGGQAGRRIIAAREDDLGASTIPIEFEERQFAERIRNSAFEVCRQTGKQAAAG